MSDPSTPDDSGAGATNGQQGAGASWWSDAFSSALVLADQAASVRNRFRNAPGNTNPNNQAIAVPVGSPRSVGPTLQSERSQSFADLIANNATAILLVSVGVLVLALTLKKLT